GRAAVLPDRRRSPSQPAAAVGARRRGAQEDPGGESGAPLWVSASMRFVLFVLALAAGAASAQNYPTKPIRLVVPFAPGGSSTIVARSVAAEMSKALGQDMYIENKGGGGGNLAMHDVARADPDGYTLIIGHVGSLAMTPFIT